MNKIFQSGLLILACCFCSHSQGSSFIPIPEGLKPYVTYAQEHPVNGSWVTAKIQEKGGCLLKNGNTKTWEDFLNIKQDPDAAKNVVGLVFPRNFGQRIPENFCYGMRSLQFVLIPDAIQDIAPKAFHACSVLSEIYGGKNLKKIGDFAFHGCFLLKNFTFPFSLKSIGRFAFGLTGLEEIIISSNIEEIAANAFHSSRQLKIIYLPVNIQNLGAAFLSCMSLSGVVVMNDEHQDSYYDFLKKLFNAFIGIPTGNQNLDLEHPAILYVVHPEICQQDLNRLNEELRQQNKGILNVKIEPKPSDVPLQNRQIPNEQAPLPNEQNGDFFSNHPVLATTLTLSAGVAAWVGMKVFGKKK